MAKDGQDDFWQARTPSGAPGSGPARPRGERLTTAADLPSTAGLAAVRSDGRSIPPHPRTSRAAVLAAVAVVGVVALAVAVVLVLRGEDVQIARVAAPLTLAEPAPDEVDFTDDECGPWSPEESREVRGWLYRACLRRDDDDPRLWVSGVQVHNVGTETDDLQVYVTYLSVGPGGRSPITLRRGDITFKEVDADAVVTRAVARYRHPGGEACAWLEGAPLFLDGQQWSASPGVKVDGGRCERPKVDAPRATERPLSIP